VARLFAGLVMGVNFLVPTLGDTAQGWVFAGDGLVAGLVIARWWAIGIASSMLLVSLTVSPGHEDTQGFLVFIVGILGGISRAVLMSRESPSRRASRCCAGDAEPQRSARE
jgi:hypothetical protein